LLVDILEIANGACVHTYHFVYDGWIGMLEIVPLRGGTDQFRVVEFGWAVYQVQVV
jgi:hypothetical protein